MALTDHSDVFGSVHEGGINRIIRHLMRQRPSIFNYGTAMFASNRDRLCREIDVHPEVTRRGNPVVSVQEPLPIFGTGGAWGMDFCAQLVAVELDFHPSNLFGLPPELAPLGSQQFALRGEACGAIVCPRQELVERLSDDLAGRPISLPGQPTKGSGYEYEDDRPKARPPIQPIPGGEPLCFCLELFGVGHFEILDSASSPVLAARLDGLELVDINPEGLENSLECYLATTIRLSLLPRVRVSLDSLIFDLGKFASLHVKPTANSADVPHNPAVEDDHLKVFVDVEVS